LRPEIFDILEETEPGRGGEIQLTDALTIQAEQAPLHGVISTIGRRDVGTPLGWIEAVIEAGLDHPEFGQGLREWLREVV
jgi:UTP--glucose-1-phosphate uridylyltransferase